MEGHCWWVDYDDSRGNEKKKVKDITMIDVSHNYSNDESGIWVPEQLLNAVQTRTKG